MRSFERVFVLVVIAAALCLVNGAPANAACLGFSGTADGFDQRTAVTRAQAAVAQAIIDYRTGKRLGSAKVSAMRAKPQPYWRDAVAANLFYKPDIVNASSHTVCWQGVISPYVCTSGAKACW